MNSNPTNPKRKKIREAIETLQDTKHGAFAASLTDHIAQSRDRGEPVITYNTVLYWVKQMIFSGELTITENPGYDNPGPTPRFVRIKKK